MAQQAKTISLDEVAEVFGLTNEGIRLWRKDGMPTRLQGGRPRFVLRECIAWRREQDRAVAAEQQAPDEARERVRKLKAEADLKELDLRLRRGELIERLVMEESLERLIGGFAAVAMGRLTPFERKIVSCRLAGDARKLTDAMKQQLMLGARSYADEWEAEADEIEKLEAI